MVERLGEAFTFDRHIRVADDKANPEGGRLLAADVDERVVLTRNDVKVTAFRVDHDPVTPALGFRIDYRGHAVVLSGDTRKSQNLIEHARGVDVLVHEVAAATAKDLEQSALSRSVLAHHTTPREAAEVFRDAAPRLAVYSHIVLRGGATEREVMDVTKRTYRGAVVMGEDLTQIDVATRRVTRRKRRAP